MGDIYRLRNPQSQPLSQGKPDGLVVLAASDVNPQPVNWLWEGWLPRGKLTILGGQPGQGKTTIAMALAARTTTGGLFPGGGTCEPGNVLIWSTEDDPGDTLKPRLMAANADMERIHFIQGSRVEGEVRAFDLQRDMEHLNAWVEKIGGISLMILDPVVAVVKGDSHKNTEVRRDLQPLIDFGMASNAAVIGITHFSKGSKGQDPAQRLVGSIGFAAVARVIMVAAKVQSDDGEDRRVLARAKSNIGPDDGGFEYSVAQAEVKSGLTAAHIQWGQQLTGSARDLLHEGDSDNDADEDQGDEAEKFLKAVLAEGPTPVKAIMQEAKDAGISEKAVRRAKTTLHVIIKKAGMTDGWYWQLPKMT